MIDVEVKQIPAQLALVVHTRGTLETVAAEMGAAFGTLMRHAQATGAQFAGPPVAVYPEMPEGEFAFDVCMPVAPGAVAGDAVPLEELPAVEAATCLHKGPYTTIGQTWERLVQWAAENGRQPGGAAREVYLNDPQQVRAEEILTELVMPLA